MFMKSLQRAAVRSNTAIRFNSTVAKTAPKALSNAYIGNLETRWSKLPEKDQQTLIDELKTRMELPWQELSPAEKRAAYYISFGEWGPRTPLYLPGERAKVFWYTFGTVIASIVLFVGIRQLADPYPHTMNREWQEQSDEYLKSKNANPFTGYSQVQ